MNRTPRLLAGPEHPATDDLARLGHVEIAALVAERGVEDLTLAPPAFPDDWHHRPGDPGGIGAIEGGGRQDFVRRNYQYGSASMNTCLSRSKRMHRLSELVHDIVSNIRNIIDRAFADRFETAGQPLRRRCDFYVFYYIF